MNFFGHAVVASWSDGQPKRLLGSMLPDFETMVRVPLRGVPDAEVRRGIVLHHRTDDLFHRTVVFLSLCAEALGDLGDLGVRRGTARAVAHIGVEMFLDGHLVDDPAHVGAYLSALELEPDGLVHWEDEGRAFSKLRDRLGTWGAPRDYAEPSFVLERLTDALRARPALAILDEQSEPVGSYLPTLQRAVERRAPELLTELQDALGFED